MQTANNSKSLPHKLLARFVKRVTLTRAGLQCKFVYPLTYAVNRIEIDLYKYDAEKSMCVRIEMI